MKVIVLSVILSISSFASAKDSTDTNEQSLNSKIVGMSDKVSGKYLHQYANMWWQWTRTMNHQDSAVVDRVGDKCHINQRGDVWFLAGGFGSSTIHRKCTIPSDKYIFFPIINMAYWPKKNHTPSCEKVKNNAALNNDELLSLHVELNGVTIPEAKNYRIKSENCFDLFGLIPRELNPIKVYPSATDGYWLMLKPLSQGKHTLKFSAQYNRQNGAFGKMAQDIIYDLEIK